MSSDLFVSYLHADDGGSDRSGSLLAVQRAAVDRYLDGRGQRAAEIVESGSEGWGPDRPRLREALALCRRRGATLLMAELGAFAEPPSLRALGGALRRLDLRFAVADRPWASEVTLGIMAALAEAEDRWSVCRSPESVARRHAFYARCTADGRAGKPSAVNLRPRPSAEGHAAPARRSRERAVDMAPLLREIRAAGALTLEQVANALNALGVPSARGGRWYPMQVTRVERRLVAGSDTVRRKDPSLEHALHP